MANTFTNLLFHIIFSTKNRVPSITQEIELDLFDYLGALIRSERGTLLQIGGMPDHIHLLARFRADTPVAEMLRKIKGNSSGWVRKKAGRSDWPGWQVGYAAFSVSESQVPGVGRYIREQKRHHGRRTFREELVALLERHGIDFDDRYLLG